MQQKVLYTAPFSTWLLSASSLIYCAGQESLILHSLLRYFENVTRTTSCYTILGQSLRIAFTLNQSLYLI